MRKTNTKIVKALLVGTLLSTLSPAVSVYANEAKLVQDASEVKLPKEFTTPVYGSSTQKNRTNKNTVKFIKQIAKQANESALKHNLYTSVTIAQAIIESGSGESDLSRSPHYNLFGIKGAYNGRTANFKTSEEYNGKKMATRANFASYPSWKESLEHHDKLLRKTFYKGAWKENTRSYRDATRWLTGRYATGSTYASKLNAVIEAYNLTRFDSPLTQADLKWLESNSLDMWEIPPVEYIPKDIQTWATVSYEVPEKFKDLIGVTETDKLLNLSKEKTSYVKGKLLSVGMDIHDEIFSPLDIVEPKIASILTQKYNMKNRPSVGWLVDLTSSKQLEIGENAINPALVEAIHPDGDVLISYSLKSSPSIGMYRIIPSNITHTLNYIQPKFVDLPLLNIKENQ